MKTFFWFDLQKGASCAFVKTLGAIFSSQTTLGPIFARIFRDYAQIFKGFAQNYRHFAQIFRNFAQIFDKSRLSGVRLQPQHSACYTTAGGVRNKD